MTGKKIKEVIDIYRERFKTIGLIEPMEMDHDTLYDTSYYFKPLQHAHSMLNKIDAFVDDGRIDKAFRWLGFLQGVLWCKGWYTLNELKNHNRPSDEVTE